VDQNNSNFKMILKVATPLILQMSSVMLMQMVDAVFLSWYSAEAVAATITAGLASYLITCLFSGTAGFTTTLVAQYHGAGQDDKISQIVKHGFYFSVVSGCVVAAMTFFSGHFFRWAGHAPIVMHYEIVFFNILCQGAFFSIASAAITGFFSGRGKTSVVMIAQFISLGVNALLDYLLIFGKYDLPRLGVTGAALATVFGQASGFFFLVAAYFRSTHHIHKFFPMHFFIDWHFMMHFLKYGIPNGIRFFIDMLAWTVFPFFIGRIGTLELAASNIAFRINSIAFFPVIGLSVAVSILVGQSQGAQRPDHSYKIWIRGLLLGEAFTGVLALAYLLFSHQFYLAFYNVHGMSPQYFTSLSEMGAMMLKLVAIYCLFDTISIITLGLLQGAGDTRWTMSAAVIIYMFFFAVLFWIDHIHGSVKTMWIAATVFIIGQSILWFCRFVAGKWKRCTIVEKYDV
jgi:multidrug resistance protein, MATE family